MIVTIIGKKHLKFHNDKDNKDVELFTLNCIHKNPMSDNIAQYEGEGCSQINVPEHIFNSSTIGQRYSFDFDRNGKLLEVSEI